MGAGIDSQVAKCLEITQKVPKALEAWRTRLVEAQEKEDILGMKYFLTRFVTKIEVDYHTARLFYTCPIDDLKSIKDDFTAWGHHENSEFNSEFSLL